MQLSHDERDPVEALAEEFLARSSHGKNVSVQGGRVTAE
jgi:hypothetical protein